MTAKNPRCLDCGGQVWAGRCRACRRWQKICESCGEVFTSVRRDARHCHRRCVLRTWRKNRPAQKSPRDADIHLDIVITMRQGKSRPVHVATLSLVITPEAG